MSNHPLDDFKPNCDELLRLVFQHVDASMLQEIAEADYGQDAEEHLEQLRAIKRGKIPAPMRWEPREVLELIRWSEPEDSTWAPGASGQRGHWIRLFACAVLLRADAEPANEGYFTGQDSTIVMLVDSAIKLGDRTATAALQFLCWRMLAGPLYDWDRSHFAVAILILLVSLGKRDTGTVKFLVEEASRDHTDMSAIFTDCQKSKTWQTLTCKFLTESKSSTSALKQFAQRFVPAAEA
ncbi:hypothetical protein [Roseimaritima ulvae]|uniref:Uncharacterized protein n=1 Tax=Roseimaritima ulvae TaxID=980254 RepID=A0A5B9R8M6_9BACT|nr:hypothetical protein [Roseimaritima ulvae]QEG43191.1 hypothetical protein UC8_52360 [Roseimaritima ulvae]